MEGEAKEIQGYGVGYELKGKQVPADSGLVHDGPSTRGEHLHARPTLSALSTHHVVSGADDLCMSQKQKPCAHL